jgi:hypothetical protein
MKVITIVEDNPITGVRYGTVEVAEYNNNIKRRLDRFYNARNKYRNIAHTKHIRQK